MNEDKIKRLIESYNDSYYDVNFIQDKEDELFQNIVNFSKNERLQFIEFVDNQSYDSDSYRPIIYEAIMDNAIGLENFLFRQVYELIDMVEQNDVALKNNLSILYYLTNSVGLESTYYLRLLEYFMMKIKSNVPEIRLISLESIIDLNLIINKKVDTTTINTLIGLIEDKSFKVRMMSYLILKNEDLLPDKITLNLFDRIKVFFNKEAREYRNSIKLGKKIVDEISSKQE